MFIKLEKLQGMTWDEAYLSPNDVALLVFSTTPDKQPVAQAMLTCGLQWPISIKDAETLLSIREIAKTEIPQPFIDAWPEIREED